MFPGGSAGKESAFNEGHLGSVPGLGRSLEKGMANHFSILAWKIPWAIQSMGSQKAGHDWVTFTFQSKVWVGFEGLLPVSQVGAVFRKNLHLINGVYTKFKNYRERRNPAPPTRTPTKTSVTKKPWQATDTTPSTVRKVHNKENSTNCQNTERPPQMQ